MAEPAPPALERVSTGSREFDALLGGGIPVGSVTLVTGDPGSGKTVFALQQVFQAARDGRRCLYVTTLSEPAVRLIRYMQLFSFFDQRLLEEAITFRDLGDALLTQGPHAAGQQLQELVEAEEPELVVIDSFKVFHDLLGESEARHFMYELAVTLSAWGATTLLLGEYAAEEPMNLPEFGIADGIIRLGRVQQGLTSVRELQVL
jgi:circadian clock protein KaiC